jgi:hypothetical protein
VSRGSASEINSAMMMLTVCLPKTSTNINRYTLYEFGHRLGYRLYIHDIS